MTIRFMDEEITASEEVLRDIACTYKFASQTCAAKGYMAAAKVSDGTLWEAQTALCFR